MLVLESDFCAKITSFFALRLTFCVESRSKLDYGDGVLKLSVEDSI